MPTLAELQNQTLSLLNESSNSSIASLASGTGGADTITTTTQITTFLQEAVSVLCRSCYPVSRDASLAVTAGTGRVLLSAFTVTGGGQLWAIRTAYWAGNMLDYTDTAVLELILPYMGNAPATPKFWDKDGANPDTIGLYPKPVANGTLSATGYVVPTLVGSGEAVPWLAPDRFYLLPKYAASGIALKNAEDDTVGPRHAAYRAEFDVACNILWEKLDPMTRRAYYPMPPMGAGKK